MKLKSSFLFLAGTSFLTGCSLNTLVEEHPATGINQLDHIVVIYLENRSFDNMYAFFPGATSFLTAKEIYPQVDKSGKPYETLPPVMNAAAKPPAPDTRFPQNLPNKPFLIDQYVGLDQKIPDLTHLFYHNQEQINGGRNDKFAAISNAQGLTMGYHDTRSLGLWKYAQDYTLADNFFQAAFGGSFLNHIWLACACMPRYENAPAELVAVLDENGKLVKDGKVTPDGYAINTIQTVYQPHDAKITDKSKLLPPQTAPTLGDRLSEKNISWAWYSGGWNDAIAGKPAESFQFHHQPYAFFQNYADGSIAKQTHLKDKEDLLKDIENNNLPSVTFYKPLGKNTQHPGYADVVSADKDVVDLIQRIEKSPMWKKTAIIVTYDENGGLWDHVAPPKIDRWGPGTRIPAMVISPFAKRGFIDHTEYNTTSVLKFIETRFDLAPLTDRDAKANNLTNAFNF
jgi:phospholipase C